MAEVLTYRENQIGGCVTIITAEVDGKTHRIMIDYGSSLDGSDTEDHIKHKTQKKPPKVLIKTNKKQHSQTRATRTKCRTTE